MIVTYSEVTSKGGLKDCVRFSKSPILQTAEMFSASPEQMHLWSVQTLVWLVLTNTKVKKIEVKRLGGEYRTIFIFITTSKCSGEKKKTYSNSGSYTLFLTLRETSTTCLYRTIFKVIFMLTIGCIAQNRQTLSTLCNEIIKTEFSLKSRWLVSGRSKDFAQFQF